jgi:hypothetical protein
VDAKWLVVMVAAMVGLVDLLLFHSRGIDDGNAAALIPALGRTL